jgi:C-terminal processing protease CtpA/Prc
VPGKRFGGTKPVYVLTSPRTFSGAEELAYDLQQLGRAVVVGERTGGGAHPRRGFRVHPHLEATIPTGRAINPVSGTNWELVGVTPDLEVPADEALVHAHREALRKLAR